MEGGLVAVVNSQESNERSVVMLLRTLKGVFKEVCFTCFSGFLRRFRGTANEIRSEDSSNRNIFKIQQKPRKCICYFDIASHVTAFISHI